jgi:hypothetical protein
MWFTWHSLRYITIVIPACNAWPAINRRHPLQVQPHRLINPAHQSHYIIPPCLQREPESHGNHKQGAHVCTHARISTATRPSRGQELLQEHRRKTLLQHLSFPNAQTTTGSLCKPMWLYNSKGTNMQTSLSQF